MIDTEQALLAAMAGGDKNAFNKVYLEYKDDLLTVLVWLLKDRAMAEDVLHDVFVSLAQRARLVKLRGTLRNYLVTSCLNRARSLMRRRGKGEALTRKAVCPQYSIIDDPIEEAIINEECGRVVTALASLPEEQREVVTLHIHGQLTFREIAELLAISINTVQSRYRYALSSLKTMFVRRKGVEQ